MWNDKNHMKRILKMSDKKEIVYVSAYPEAPQDEEIDLLEVWQVIWGAKWFITAVTLTATIVAVIVSLYVLPVTYRSDAVINQTSSDGSGGLGGLAGLAASLALPVSLPGSEELDNIMPFLMSRNLKKRLIEKYELLPHMYRDIWDTDKKEWLVEKDEQPSVVMALQFGVLDGVFGVVKDKRTGLITLSWVDTDPEFAAKMVERVIDELQYYLDHDYEFDAKRELEFVVGQLQSALEELEYWEKQVPSQKLTKAKIKRELLAAQTVYAELRKQVTLARISEAKELVRFKIVDAPYVPEYRYKPKRSFICLMVMLLSGLAAICMVFMHKSFMEYRAKRP